MGIEEGTLIARGALSTLNSERRYWLEELRKVCTEIQNTNTKLLSAASRDEFSESLTGLVVHQGTILEKLKQLAPQRQDLQRRAWGSKQPF